MTRFIFDQFAKDYLEELLSPLGEVQTDRKIRSEVREIDLWFAPRPQPETNPESLGLLGRLATTPAIFEPYRNPVTTEETESCLLKLLDLRLEQRRQARRENRRLLPLELTRLWILTPTASDTLLQSFSARLETSDWGEGIYLLTDALRSAFVVIHRLPRTPSTLWLRLLGRGRVQQQAIDELEALPPENLLRSRALELLINLRVVLEARQNIEPEDRELIMRLSTLYQQRLSQATEQGVQQGVQRGVQQERQRTIETLLRLRFSSLDEDLLAIIEPLAQLSPEEYMPMVMQLSREELIARLQSNEGSEQ